MARERPERAGPARFRDAFAVPGFRALWVAQLASVAGDQLARVALTVLVYDKTSSALLAAVTFVASVVPVFIGGVALAGLADRFPRRRVMIACDVLRCAVALVMALPAMPLGVLVALLAVVTLAGAPFTAARAAVYPELLPGDRYVAGTAVTLITSQFAQVAGFAAGGAAVALLGTRTSLVIDAATFAASAVIVAVWVRQPPARGAVPAGAGAAAGARAGTGTGTAAAARAGTGAGTGAGARARTGTAAGAGTGTGTADPGRRLLSTGRLVFRNPAMLLPMLFGWLAAFYNAPEGVATPLASGFGRGAGAVGAILAAQVLGETAGMLVFSRLVRPAARLRLMGPLAVAACAVLALFAADPGLDAALAILAVSGAFGAYQVAANAAFVREVPRAWRARSFGLAQGGMSLGQGTMMIAAGAAAQRWAATMVVAVVGGVGAVCAAVIAARWTRLRRDGLTRCAGLRPGLAGWYR